MKRPDPRFRVGLVLTVFCALLFVMVFSLDGTLSIIKGSDRVQVRFPSAQGLMRHDPVHFHGVPCGRVVDLAFEPPQQPMNIAHAEALDSGSTEVSVLLTLEVPPHVREYLRDGSRAQIEKTLTGVTVVNLSQGEGLPLSDGDILEGTAEATIADVAAGMEGAIASLGRILSDLEPVAASFSEESMLPATFERFGKAADEVRDLAEQLQHTSNDLGEPLRELTTRARELVNEIERGARELPDLLSEMRTTARKAGDVAEGAQTFIRDTAPKWKAASEDLAATSANARALTAEIRRRPWRLLKSPGERDAKTLDLYETADRYADGALQMRRSLELVRDALGRRSADPQANAALGVALESLEASIAAQAAAERIFWERMAQITE